MKKINNKYEKFSQPLKETSFEQEYIIPIRIFESYNNKKIVKKYNGNDKGCEPEFEPKG